MNILVLNCGSATIKFQIIETDRARIAADSDRRLASGGIEHIGDSARITLEAEGRPKESSIEPLADYRAAIDRIFAWIAGAGIEGVRSLRDIHAVGHRVVHGGERFRDHVLIDQAVLAGIEDCVELAPLHNPVNLKGIRAAVELLGPGTPQVAVFDTAFHSTMPEASYLYGLPYELYEKHGIRRYGFHGTSHRYLGYRYRQVHNLKLEDVNIISLHLGNGCSACAIKNGASIDTSMGFTPLEGLLMGTRAGDVDASILDFLHHKEGLSFAEIDTLLNKRSGLLGISGLTNDMRELIEEEEENQDRRAKLAIDIFCKRVRKYIGAYFVEMAGSAEAVVFAGGIGENSALIRQRICRGLESIGLKLDPKRNEDMHSSKFGIISTDDSTLKAFVFRTNEELLIARDTVRVIENAPRRW